jgi:exportin-2 (importin alpha re-exporter)
LQDKPGFGIVILELISAMTDSSSPQDIAVRQSAAVLFKNIVKKKWSPTEDEIPIPESDRDGIKTHIIDLMCTTSRAVQQQLAEAVSIISKYDFPGKWLTLLPHLVEKMQSDDIHVVHGVLLTANSIMKRFRYAFKSDELYEELLYCLKGFQEPLTELFVNCAPLLEKCEQAGSREDTVIVLEILRLISRIFFSLNWQDIPEFFEDNTGVWMPEFAKYVTYSNPSLEDESETSEPGPVEKLKASIIESLVLYVTKYEEMFADYLPKYTEIIWQLLVEVKTQPKYDTLATGAIKFLTSVSSKQMNTHLFNDDILQQIVEQIVVPNLMATENDEELFEDNPLDYIVKDIEGSDQDTRRRCAAELVRALLKHFSEKTTELCVSYITGMLKQYESTACRDWRAKDGALHLVLAAAVMSTSSSQGAGSLNPNMDILEIFNVHVLPELHDSDVNARPIVKADAIKLICTFRSHFPAPFLLELLPHLVRHLTSEYIVVQTYAALCIEKFLTVKDSPADPSASTVLSLTVTPGS